MFDIPCSLFDINVSLRFKDWVLGSFYIQYSTLAIPLFISHNSHF